MTDHEALMQYVPMVDFIADVCGPSCEVLLHDVTNPEESVIAIRNGFHSGRTFGSPMTELALCIMKNEDYKDCPYIANYRGSASNRKFRSSTYYIKNGEKLVGMLCVNCDMSAMLNLQSAFEGFMMTQDFEKDDKDLEEDIGNPMSSLANAIISKVIRSFHVSPARMSSEEKQQVVQKLNDQGVLMLKGAVSEIADQLLISEGTVYRYASKR